jgi:hypothetical protein
MGTVDTRVARRGYFRISLLASVYYPFAAPNPFDIPRRRVNRSADHRVRPARFPRANVNILIPLGRADIDSRMTKRRSVASDDAGRGDRRLRFEEWNFSSVGIDGVSLRQISRKLPTCNFDLQRALHARLTIARFHVTKTTLFPFHARVIGSASNCDNVQLTM